MSNHSELSNKTLVMLVGPSAIGKSALMEEISSQDTNFAYVRSFTTRQKRANEQGHYSFTDEDTAKQLKQSGQAITYFEHPTTHDIYGTTIESYPAKFNLLDTLSGSVAGYRNLPFERTVTIAITASAVDWRKWFTSRYPEPTSEANKRLQEAKISIKWALNDPESHWIVNSHNNLADTANFAISTILNPPPKHEIPSEPYDMLKLIEDGMWR